MSDIAAQSSTHHTLSVQLQSQFACKQDPFGSLDGFFFQGAQRQHNLDTMQHLINFGDMVLLLTGDKGSGKTTLLNRLVKQIETQVRFVVIDGARIPSVAHLKQIFAKKLALHVTSDSSLEEVFDAFGKVFPGERLCLMVDDAHNIGRDVLQVLLTVFRKHSSVGSAVSVALLLTGTQRLMQELASEGVDPEKAKWMYQIPLKPLSSQEIFTYLQLRFMRAGAGKPFEMSEQRLAILSSKAKGNFGRINKLAPAVLLDVFGVERRSLQYRIAWIKFAAAVGTTLVLSALVIAYLYGMFDAPAYAPVEKGEVARGSVAEESAQGEDVVEVARKTLILPVPNSLQSPVRKQEEAIIPEVSKEQKEIQSSKENVSAIPMPDIKERGEKKAPEVTDVERKVEHSDGVVENSTAASKEDGEKKAVVPVPAPTEVLKSVSLLKKSLPSEKAGSDGVVTIAEHVAISETYERDGSWLRLLPRGSYSIQVLGSRNRDTAVEFIKQQKHKQLFYVNTVYKSKPWYVVFYGTYDDAKAARAALSGLPKSLARQNPWPRSIKGIVDALPAS